MRRCRAWGGAILCFLAGVRRGLSFAMPGGATPGEIASSLLLFALGVLGLALPLPAAALGSLMLGYIAVGPLDFRAARGTETPRFFAQLRPTQAALAVVALAVLLASDRFDARP